MEKDFIEWHKVKRDIHKHDERPFYHEREIWWCALGVNVGVEIDGKNGKFERPVLILKYINKDMVLVSPLTTKGSPDKNHIKIDIDGTISFVKISQIRVVSNKRLLRKISTLSEDQFKYIRKRVVRFIS